MRARALFISTNFAERSANNKCICKVKKKTIELVIDILSADAMLSHVVCDIYRNIVRGRRKWLVCPSTTMVLLNQLKYFHAISFKIYWFLLLLETFHVLSYFMRFKFKTSFCKAIWNLCIVLRIKCLINSYAHARRHNNKWHPRTIEKTAEWENEFWDRHLLEFCTCLHLFGACVCVCVIGSRRLMYAWVYVKFECLYIQCGRRYTMCVQHVSDVLTIGLGACAREYNHSLHQIIDPHNWKKMNFLPVFHCSERSGFGMGIQMSIVLIWLVVCASLPATYLLASRSSNVHSFIC